MKHAFPRVTNHGLLRGSRGKQSAAASMLAIFLLGAMILLTGQAIGQQVPSGVGVPNPTLALCLSTINDWSTELPFLDRMKQARPWQTEQPGDDMDYAALKSDGYLDEQGWPTSIPKGADSINTTWSAGLAANTQTFVLTYDGEGLLYLLWPQIVSARPGRIEFIAPGNTTFWLKITSTDPRGNGNYIRNLRLVPSKYESLADAGEIFNPDWLVIVQDLRQVRFMDWMSTNGSTISDWDERPQVADFSYVGDFGRGTAGVPIEVMVELANKIGADPWFNMPHLASDQYVQQFATYVRDHLSPGLVAYVEYSNEPWNFAPGFSQTQWMRDTAAALWGTAEVAGIAPNNLDYQAMRATQVATIWDAVFGEAADARVQNVLNLQTGNAWWLENRILNGLVWGDKDPEHFVEPASVIDAVAQTSYFGGIYIADGMKRAELLAHLAEHSVDETYTWLADRLVAQGQDDTIPAIASHWASVEAVTSPRGIGLLLYEGGQHAHIASGDPMIGEFYKGFVRSRQMGNLYAASWDAWKALPGDGPFMHFLDVAAPSSDYSWGLLSHLGDTNPRADELFSRNAEGKSWFGDGGGTRYQQGVIKIAGNANETLTGTDKDDVLVGGEGDDLFIPGFGHDKINGGGGNDIVQVAGARAEYVIAPKNDGWHLEGSGVSGFLVNVEVIEFVDTVTRLVP